jgi:hypothetical protein
MAMVVSSGALPIVPLNLMAAGAVGAGLSFNIDWTKYKKLETWIHFNSAGPTSCYVAIGGSSASGNNNLYSGGNIYATTAYDATLGKCITAWQAHNAGGGDDFSSGGTEINGNAAITISGNGADCIAYATAVK